MAKRRTKGNRRLLPRISKANLKAMIEEATVDCYNESEQITGWFTMIEENLAVPFETMVLGVPVTVERVDLDECDQIVAMCSRDRYRQLMMPILDLPLPSPPPDGAEWIEAYRHWRREGYPQDQAEDQAPMLDQARKAASHKTKPASLKTPPEFDPARVDPK